MKKRIVLSALLFSIIGACTFAGPSPIGEFSFSMGGNYPQGNFTEFADPGLAGSLKVNFRLNKLKAFSGWLGLDGTMFSYDRSDVDIIVDRDLYFGDKSITKYSIAFHTGIQLGSDTRRGFVRPRAGIAPGLYFFNTNTTVSFEGEDEPFLDDTDTQVRVGWQGILGVDLFFVSKWGISLDFVHDHVVNLHNIAAYASKESGIVTVSKSARFQSFMIGVVIPLDLMED